MRNNRREDWFPYRGVRWSGTEEVNATHGTFVHLLCLRKTEVAEGDILINGCCVYVLEVIEDLSGCV